jgi:hypothetical protein
LNPIRILLVGFPRMMTDILEELIDSEPDLCLAGELEEHEGVPALAALSTVDVVVAALPGPEVPAVYEALLADHRIVRGLAIVDDGPRSFVLDIGLGPDHSGIASLEGVLSAIRGTGRGRQPSRAWAGDPEVIGGGGA